MYVQQSPAASSTRRREMAPRPVPRPDRKFYAASSAFGRFGMRWFDPMLMEKEHFHGHIELNWLTAGSMDYVIDGHALTVPANRLIMFWAGIPHRTVGIDRGPAGDSRQCNVYLPLDTFLHMPNLGRLTELTHETQEQSAELAAINTEQRTLRQRLEADKRARIDVLVKVSRQIEKQRREISTLKRDENRLARLIEQLSQMLSRPRSRSERLRNERVPDASGDGTAFSQLKGRLNLPVRGELRNRFGSPREDSGLSWKGLFIAAPAGQEVKAIAAGRIVFADWLRGFGNLLIIDHGGGYMSLYGNNESLFKRVGEAAQGGETVAGVGNSGGNTNSGLYFEIRYQGKAFDPLGWINLK